jgi:hypothetical protein
MIGRAPCFLGRPGAAPSSVRSTGIWDEFKGLAYQALNFCLYAVNNNGCFGQRATGPSRGSRQEDAHTDKLHNILDAIAAFPEWAN